MGKQDPQPLNYWDRDVKSQTWNVPLHKGADKIMPPFKAVSIIPGECTVRKAAPEPEGLPGCMALEFLD